METKQCQAFVESKGRRCEKTIRWGKKYCWWHYPKAGTIFGLILGAFLALILTLLFSGPLMSSLSQVPPFHYLDRNDPIVVGLVPDIRASDYIDSDTRTFSVTCRDDCSGLDFPQCRINLYCLKNNEYEPLSGKSNINENRFDFMVDTELTHGEYYLRITLFDNANNMSESEYSFMVPENDIIDITFSYEEYDEAKHRKLVRFLPNELGTLFDKMRLYVYHYGVRNRAEKTYCKSVHISVDNPGVIYSWEETGGLNYTGVVSLSVTEALHKRVPKNRVFVTERKLSIEEIGPGGFVLFVALVGLMDFDNFRPKESTPMDIGVFGTYVSEGYGRTTIENVRRWIPIKKRNSNN